MTYTATKLGIPTPISTPIEEASALLGLCESSLYFVSGSGDIIDWGRKEASACLINSTTLYDSFCSFFQRH